MGLLDTEAGKRRLLSVEVPAIEAYNDGRDPEYRISVTRLPGGLVLSYRLKPCRNTYSVETRLLSSYPVVPPETRILTPLKHCPHLLEGQTLCLWRQGSTRASSRWDPAQFTCVFAVLAAWRLARVLRTLARNRRVAAARSEMTIVDWRLLIGDC